MGGKGGKRSVVRRFPFSALFLSSLHFKQRIPSSFNFFSPILLNFLQPLELSIPTSTLPRPRRKYNPLSPLPEIKKKKHCRFEIVLWFQIYDLLVLRNKPTSKVDCRWTHNRKTLLFKCNGDDAFPLCSITDRFWFMQFVEINNSLLGFFICGQEVDVFNPFFAWLPVRKSSIESEISFTFVV